MLIIWGQRMYGRVDHFAGSHVATRFFHIYYVPLIPLSSWLVLEDQGEGRFLGKEVPLQGRSVLKAWGRVMSAMLLLWTGVGLIPAFERRSSMDTSAVIATLMVSLAIVGVVGWWAWLKAGKLDERQKAARVVYWDFAGQFVDVGLLKDQANAIKAKASEELDKHLARHATSTYREAPQASWREIATRADMRDVPLLKAALTRCRVEEAQAVGEEKKVLSLSHAKILANLLAASPELLDVSQYEMR